MKELRKDFASIKASILHTRVLFVELYWFWRVVEVIFLYFDLCVSQQTLEMIVAVMTHLLCETLTRRTYNYFLIMTGKRWNRVVLVYSDVKSFYLHKTIKIKAFKMWYDFLVSNQLSLQDLNRVLITSISISILWKNILI